MKLLGQLPEIHIESSDSEDDLENESVSSDIVPLNEVAYLPDVEDIHVISEAIDRESTRDDLTLESEAIDRSSTRDDLIIETGIRLKDSVEESNLVQLQLTELVVTLKSRRHL